MGSSSQGLGLEYDFIVVGGSTAGNVVAGRLAENPSVSVLVIEGGAGSIYKGYRSSSYVFVEGKPNVTIMSSTFSKKLVFDGTTASGITVISPEGEELTFKAKKEVIVSSGVFESPKLLLLSGIGPEEELAKHNIKSIVKSPHVGRNLLDHPIMPHVFRMKDGYGFDHHLLRAGPEHDAAIAAYRKNRSGAYSSGLLELAHILELTLIWPPARNTSSTRSKMAVSTHLVLPANRTLKLTLLHIPTPPQGDYITVIVDLTRPLSRNGVVKLNSTNPLEQPNVNLNFFSNDLDLVALREGVRFIDDILMNGEAMKDIIREDYPWPMPRHSDEAMNKMILERSQTGFHPCGTLRISKSISEGVVDSKLKVFGTDKLRVIDASVFPVIPDCRIQNAVYMVAEKGADIVKAAYPDLYQ